MLSPHLLTDPKYDWLRVGQNVGCSYLAGSLKRIGTYEIKFINVATEGFINRVPEGENLLKVGLSKEDLIERIVKFNPDVIGVSVIHTVQYPGAKEICEIVKEIDPEIITIMGGAHPSGDYQRVLKDKNVDFVIIGEGDIAIVKLLKYLEGKTTFETLCNVATKLASQVIVAPNRSFVKNLNQLPDPDFAIFNKGLYTEKIFHPGVLRGKYAIDYIGSRGCPQKCDFCCSGMMYGHTFRMFSLERIFNHFKKIRELGYNEIILEDDNILAVPIHAQAIFAKLKELKFHWSLIGGIDRSLLSEDLTDCIIENGCDRVHFAVESVNYGTLRKHDKYVKIPDEKLDKTSLYIKRFTEGGVETFADFMIGFPEEALEDINKTIEYAHFLRGNGLSFAIFNIVTPFPGTPFYYCCKQQGYIVNESAYENYTFAKGNLTTPNFTAEQMTEVRIRAMKEVNGKTLFEEDRYRLQRPNLQKYYKNHLENKWSKYFAKANDERF